MCVLYLADFNNLCGFDSIVISEIFFVKLPNKNIFKLFNNHIIQKIKLVLSVYID